MDDSPSQYWRAGRHGFEMLDLVVSASHLVPPARAEPYLTPPFRRLREAWLSAIAALHLSEEDVRRAARERSLTDNTCGRGPSPSPMR